MRNLDRHNAEDALRDLWVQNAVCAGKEGVTDLMQTLNTRIGNPIVREEQLDRDGLNRLKNLGTVNKGQ